MPALGAIAVVAILGVTVFAGLVLRLTGGDWAIVSTPSMGRAAPVGTLVLTRHEPFASIEVGDIVSYHPRNSPEDAYTHRIVAKHGDGTLQARGDVNGSPDPLSVRAQDVVGTVVTRWWGVGWLVRALPFLLVGGAVIVAVTYRFVPLRWRSATRIVSACLLVSITALVLKPFVRPVLMAVTTDGVNGPRASVVSAGLLPTRVTATGGRVLDLVSGQAGVLPVEVDRVGRYYISGSPHLNLGWLLAVAAVCALPLLWCLVVGLSPADEGGQPKAAV